MNDYKKMKVPELDEKLEELGLPTDGLKPDKIDRLMDAEISEQETPEAGRIEPEVIHSTPTYEDYIEQRLWAGVKTVYVCRSCGRQEDDEDDMILHILSHFPEDEKESLLNILIKEQ